MGGAGFTGGAPSFLVLAFFTFSLMASMSSLPSVAVTDIRSTIAGYRLAVRLHGSFTHIGFALRWNVPLSLPLVVFFIRGFSLGGMKALLRSSCFLVSASACFT